MPIPAGPFCTKPAQSSIATQKPQSNGPEFKAQDRSKRQLAPSCEYLPHEICRHCGYFPGRLAATSFVNKGIIEVESCTNAISRVLVYAFSATRNWASPGLDFGRTKTSAKKKTSKKTSVTPVSL